MNNDNIRTQIIVKEQKINVLRINNEEPRLPIRDWMRNKDVILYLGLWERINNENFKSVQFDAFKNEARSNKFNNKKRRIL